MKPEPLDIITGANRPELKHDNKKYRPNFTRLELANLELVLIWAAKLNPEKELISLAKKVALYNTKINMDAVSGSYSVNPNSPKSFMAELEEEAAAMSEETIAKHKATLAANNIPTKEQLWSQSYARYKLSSNPLIQLSDDDLTKACEHMYLNDLLCTEAIALLEAGESNVDVITKHYAITSAQHNQA